MTLADRHAARALGILCPNWVAAAPGSKRCKYYLDCGACDLPSELMCVEWLIRNDSVPKIEAQLREGRYETAEQFRTRFNREVAERAAARGVVYLPPPPSAPSVPTPPPAMPPPPPAPSGPAPQLPNSLTNALAKLNALSTRPAPPVAKTSALVEALAKLNAIK